MEQVARIIATENLELILEAGSFGLLLILILFNYLSAREMRASNDRLRTELIDIVNRAAADARSQTENILQMAGKANAENRTQMSHLMDEVFARMDGGKRRQD